MIPASQFFLRFMATLMGVAVAFSAFGQDMKESTLVASVPVSNAAPPPPPSTGGGAAPVTGNGSGGTPNNILHCDDLIRITVFQENDLTTETRITKAGSITFPLIGSVQLEGKTIPQAQEQIRSMLDKDYIVNPHVTVAIIEYSKIFVTVLGQVQKPGNVEIPNGGSGLDLLGAVALAGGYTPGCGHGPCVGAAGCQRAGADADGQCQPIDAGAGGGDAAVYCPGGRCGHGAVREEVGDGCWARCRSRAGSTCRRRATRMS